jgi:lipoprotein-anchoring transpeptidase ErfK/SrfK
MCVPGSFAPGPWQAILSVRSGASTASSPATAGQTAPGMSELNTSELNTSFWVETERPRRSRLRRWLRFAGIAVAILLVMALAGTAVAAYGAYRTERTRADLILPGVVIQGVAVGGMNEAQAMAAVSAAVEGALDRPITVTAGGDTWTETARSLGLHADVTGAVDAALAYTAAHSTTSRLLGRWRGKTYPLVVGVTFSLEGDNAARLLDQAAAAVDVKPRNARLDLSKGQVVRVHSRTGVALQTEAGRQMLIQELFRGSTAQVGAGAAAPVQLPVSLVHPKVTAGSLGRTIAVDLSHNRLSLYDGLRVIRKYSVATAKPGFLTPPGRWKVVAMRKNPTWYNPALDSWGANEPAVVPPGPGNPMGTRALYLDAPGLIRIHGTNEPSSIGHYASHGCIRLHIPDIEALYDLVKVGTRVLIYGAPPWGIPATYGIAG